MTTPRRNEAQDCQIISWTPLTKRLLTSSAWMGRPMWHKLTWITILAEKNLHGYVDLSLASLAKAAEVTIEECQDAIAWYEAPDPLSRNPACEGRHIRPCTGGGWIVINHFFYRELIASESRKVYKNQWARDKRMKFNAHGKLEDHGGNGSGDAT